MMNGLGRPDTLYDLVLITKGGERVVHPAYKAVKLRSAEVYKEIALHMWPHRKYEIVPTGGSHGQPRA